MALQGNVIWARNAFVERFEAWIHTPSKTSRMQPILNL